jgi:hypothetical protein
MAYDLSGYVDVAERIRQLREKHPDAVLRPWNPDEPFKIMDIGGREFIIYTAACYRTPDDPMPAIGVAQELAYGKTNFTAGSEVMNAETSAWGRAIVAALAADTQKIASLEEVRNRKAEQAQPSIQNHPAKGVPAPAVVQQFVKAMPPADDVPTEQDLMEIFNATKVHIPPVRNNSGAKISEKQKGLISKLAKEKVNGDVTPLLKDMFDAQSINDLSSKDASALIKHLMEVR